MKYIKDDITGSYYSIENGELIQYPQNIDGTRSNSSGAVDFDFLLYEPPLVLADGREVDLYKHLRQIEFDLSGLPTGRNPDKITS